MGIHAYSHIYEHSNVHIIRDFLSPGCHLFGVMDGHGGCRASEYAKVEMPKLLLQHLYRLREVCSDCLCHNTCMLCAMYMPLWAFFHDTYK